MKNLWLLIFIYSNIACCLFAAGDTIKVGILVGVRDFNLAANDCEILELKSAKKTFLDDGNDYNATLSGRNLIIGGKSYRLPVRITSGKSSFVTINGKRFRDSIIVQLAGSKVNVINELGIDDYVRGVLTREMNPDWPMEALKAQAIAARCFAFRNLGRHASGGFDVCSSVHCQVYGGADSESSKTDNAVFDTRGEILIDRDGQIVNTVFHACCGGYTEDVRNVWDITGDVPHYFVAKQCRFCSHYKHFIWTSDIEEEFIRKKLQSGGYNVGKIQNLEKVGSSISNRAKYIRVRHSRGMTIIPASKFRLAIDPWKMRSTKLTAIVRHKNSFEFRGYGWGHGVGMCQAGAKGMADEGYNYSEILRFYYPGTIVKKKGGP